MTQNCSLVEASANAGGIVNCENKRTKLAITQGTKIFKWFD